VSAASLGVVCDGSAVGDGFEEQCVRERLTTRLQTGLPTAPKLTPPSALDVISCSLTTLGTRGSGKGIVYIVIAFIRYIFIRNMFMEIRWKRELLLLPFR